MERGCLLYAVCGVFVPPLAQGICYIGYAGYVYPRGVRGEKAYVLCDMRGMRS